MVVMNISNLKISKDMLYKFSTLFFNKGSHSGELMNKFTVTLHTVVFQHSLKGSYTILKKFQDSVN